MKIGILTLPLHINYGGILQNYALQQALKEKGLAPVTIEHSGIRNIHLNTIRWLIKEIMYHISGCKSERPCYVPTKKEIQKFRKNTQSFIDKYIIITKTFQASKELEEHVASYNYSGFVVGSDQCWRPVYNRDFLGAMFLNFAEGMKNTHRVAYAASFGTDDWEFSPEMTEKYSHLIQLFDKVTVREDSGIALCKKYFGVEATHVLDPTMLLKKENYEKLVANEKEPKSKGDLYYYFLDSNDEKTDFIQKVAAQYGYTPFTVMPDITAKKRSFYDVKFRMGKCIYPSVTSWLRGFMDAKVVVVDSFHGMVFSIIFNKPFWAFGNHERGNARFESLLKMFHLENRLIVPSEFALTDFHQPIEWDIVNMILKEKVQESKEVFDHLK